MTQSIMKSNVDRMSNNVNYEVPGKPSGKLTPKEAVRACCKGCLGLAKFDKKAVCNCQGDQAYIEPCPLYPYRLGKRPPLKVFRQYCLQCMGGSHVLVRECDEVSCPLHEYRMGTNPALRGQPQRGKRKDVPVDEGECMAPIDRQYRLL